MNRERTITLTMSEAMWGDLVAALSRAGLAAGGGSQERSLAETVRTARLKRGLSREQLAKRAGVGANTIDRLEDEQVNPIEATLRRIALALNLEAVNLVEARDKGRVGCPHIEGRANA